jgi:aminopeptidase N
MVLVGFSCKAPQKVASPTSVQYYADTISVNAFLDQPVYRGTPPLHWRVVHTSLDITPDFSTRSVKGKAKLKLRPGYYATDSLRLDARNFDISSVALTNSQLFKIDKWRYDSTALYIRFDRAVGRGDTLLLSIVYTAYPELTQQKSGRAITGTQGFYFINPDGAIPDKPIQVWTQGETDYNSNWFPTLDEPNQKMTQEIAITLPDSMVSLSNGRFLFSSVNNDKTRTDYWVQDKPHSPYLVMVAGGKYYVYKDKWRDKEVNYYVEPAYAADAPYIFGRTPDMMEYFSQLLRTPFPWDKYSQIIVRDYVSGAMENTSATIHGEFVQKHRRELIDEPQEGIIAHELFHQWFGDLVSCEDWGNIALNESFATYGEYLWVAHDKGFTAASANLYQKKISYLRRGNLQPRPLVFHGWRNKDDMFDIHSYPKGAAILHMLRHEIGDEAFFESLAIYLKRFAHGSAEMHQLRLIMEELTGRDLHPFFNQWIFAQGHPILKTETNWNPANKTLEYTVYQRQSLDKNPLYRLSFAVGFHFRDTVIYQHLFVEDEKTTFQFSLPDTPLWIEADTARYLLAEWMPVQNRDKWLQQFLRGRHLETLSEAWRELLTDTADPRLYQAAFAALTSPYTEIIAGALQKVEWAYKYDAGGAAQLHKSLLQHPAPQVRSAALRSWLGYQRPENRGDLLQKAINDSSYRVVAEALSLTAAGDSLWALVMAQQFEKEYNHFVSRAVADIYALYGGPARFGYFTNRWESASAWQRPGLLRNLSTYLKRQSDIALWSKAVLYFGESLPKVVPGFVRGGVISLLIDIENLLLDRQKLLREKMERVPYDSRERMSFEDEIDRCTAILGALERYFAKAREVETDEKLKIKLSPR